MRINCISIHDVHYEMKLLESDLVGFHLYKLIPTELGYEPKIMYINHDRTEFWLYGKPMDGGKQVEPFYIKFTFYEL